MVEDCKEDVELIVAVLKRAGFAFVYAVCDTPSAFLEEIRSTDYDIVLCDHNLHVWTGTDALRMFRQERKDAPFIVVTASLGDEIAVDYLKNGANDYVLKSRLEHLPMAVSRSLRHRKLQRETAQLHEQIFRAKRQWELTFDALPDPMMVLDVDFSILCANRATAETLGVPFTEILGKTCGDAFQCRMSDCALKRKLRERPGLPASLEVELFGRIFHVTVNPLQGNDGEPIGYVHVMRDVSERVHAMDNIAKSERRYRQLFEHANDAILVFEPESEIILDANEKACAVYGISRTDLIGTSVKSFTKDVLRGEEEIRQLMKDRGCRNTATVRYNKSGAALDLLCNSSVIEYDGREAILAMERDVTEWKRMGEQLRQSQKMEAVGQLAAGVAHDFNNLLMVISGSAELLKDSLSDPGQEHWISQIVSAAERAGKLTQRLLAFGRKSTIVPRVVDLASFLKDIVKTVGRLIPENIRLSVAPAADLWTIKIDPVQLEQLFLNLSVNARDAMPKGGNLVIEACNVLLDAAYAASHAGVVPGEYVRVSVADTGAGIPPEALPHIFEPFFTTKKLGEGTGLGLATVFGIVTQNGGEITVESEREQGACFRIHFPRCVKKISEGDTKREPSFRGTEQLLLVEDEETLRGAVADFLRNCGYRVLAASCGEEALDLLHQKNSPGIAALVTDVVMPGLQGPDLAEQVRVLEPDLKVVFTSGYAASKLADRGLLEPGVTFLQKPFPLITLASAVRQLIDSAQCPQLVVRE